MFPEPFLSSQILYTSSWISAIVDKPQLKPKAMAKLKAKAKAWAEVVYVITKSSVPSRKKYPQFQP